MRVQFLLIPATLGALILACGSSANIIGPGNQLQVTNAPDDFQFQVTSLANVDQTLRYTWSNTGDSANVNQASAVTGGTATLTIRDPGGAVVYQSNLQTNGTFHSAKSTTGAWKIEVKLVNADGTVNFRVQKAP
jgi:hypothetical protein